MNKIPHEAGKSSFDLLDSNALLSLLPLKGARLVVDVGCGAGNYALAIAERLEPGARLLGVDLWDEGVELMLNRASEKGLTNVEGRVSEICDLSQIADGSADLVFMSTVLHDLRERGEESEALAEIRRVLRPGGAFAVVEFHKAQMRPGPPLAIRLSPQETEALVAPAGFGAPAFTDLGEHLYLCLFTAA